MACRLGILMAITMTLHNMPEGLAVAFSSYTDLGPVMALAIALHNIPEGIIVAAPIFAATGSRTRALTIATLSGLSEPLGALLALVFVRPFLTPLRLHCLLAFTGVLSGRRWSKCGMWYSAAECIVFAVHDSLSWLGADSALQTLTSWTSLQAASC
jgi:zinc transporter, ZIP family